MPTKFVKNSSFCLNLGKECTCNGSTIYSSSSEGVGFSPQPFRGCRVLPPPIGFFSCGPHNFLTSVVLGKFANCAYYCFFMFLRPRGTIFGHRGLYSNRRGGGSQGEGHQNFLRGAAIWPNSRLCLLNSKEIFQHYSAIKTFETRENKLQVQQHIAFFQKEVLTLLIISYYNIFAKRILYGWFKIVYEMEATWLNYSNLLFSLNFVVWVGGWRGRGVAINEKSLELRGTIF